MHFDSIPLIVTALLVLIGADCSGSVYISCISKVSRDRALEGHGCLSRSVLS
jgi:hypothetical protein